MEKDAVEAKKSDATFPRRGRAMRVYHPTGKGRVVPAKPLQAKHTIPLAPQTPCPAGGRRRRKEAHRSHNKRGPVRRPTLKYVVVGGWGSVCE
jgi:hypothetical protein